MTDKQTHVEVYIHAEQVWDGGYRFSAYACDMSSCGYIPVLKVQVPLPDITDEQVKARHLVLLKLERDQVYAKANVEAARLDEKIAKLESLSYDQPEEKPL